MDVNGYSTPKRVLSIPRMLEIGPCNAVLMPPIFVRGKAIAARSEIFGVSKLFKTWNPSFCGLS